MTAVLATMLWQSPWLLPMATAMLGLALAAVILLYGPQMRDVPRPWRWTPPLLRTMAIVALAISLLQPAVLRPRTAAQQGAVVILVDRSRSMSVSDRGRSSAELIALAGGLGTLPPGARRQSAPGLRGQLEAVRARLEEVERSRNEADYARLSGRGLPAAQARLEGATESLREALAAVTIPAGAAGSDLPERVRLLKPPPPTVDEVGTRALRTKLDAAFRALAIDQAKADEKLFEDAAAVRTACIRTGRLTREALVELALMQDETGLFFNLPAGAPFIAYSFADDLKLLPLPPRDDLRLAIDGPQSNVTGSVQEAMRALSGRDIQAVLLLTDGRHVSNEPANPDLSALRAPVFAVAIAQAGQRRDVSIARLDVPSSARVDQPITVHVELRAPGTTPGEAIDVQLDSPDIRRIQRVTVADDWTAVAEFEITFSRAGPAGLSVMALPLANEISDQNNRAQRWVKVAQAPLRVTMLTAADSGRQKAALHEVLSRAPWVTLRELEEAESFKITESSLAGQDLVILVDLPADALWPEQWDALDNMVRNRGGSVVICAGAHLPGGGYATATPAIDWLPYEIADKPTWQTWPGGDPHFRVEPVSNVADVQLASAWDQLPALSRFVALKKLRPNVTPLLTERASSSPIITEASRGRGKVVFIGTDETWRWHARAGERQPFWPELLRHVAPEPYAASAGSVWLDASTIAPRPRQPITLRARARGANDTIEVRVERDDQLIKTVTLRSIVQGRLESRYEGPLDGLDAGDYTLRLDPPDEAYAEPALLDLHVQENFEAELSDLSGDERLLRRVADSSAGRFVPLDQLQTLPRLLNENRGKQDQLVEYTLWDSPWLFGFVLACLSTEWALRKKFGLA